jgi:hypothetical protein
MIGSFGALFNGLCKIILASSLDYFPFKPIYTGILVAMISSLILVHFSTSNAYAFGACIWVNFFGGGAMTSMLPVVTMSVFGQMRGYDVYSYMYSIFGVASFTGLLMVELLQHKIGYTGMLFICLFFTFSALGFTYFYKFNEPLNYS